MVKIRQKKKIKLSNPLLEKAKKSFNAGHITAARESCSRILKNSPNNIEALLLHGKISHSLGDYHEAEISLQKATILGNERADSFYYYGVALMSNNKLHEAIEAFNNSCKIKENPQSFHNIGLIYNLLGDKENAKHFYTRALALPPHNHETYYNLGCIYLEQRLYGEAIELFSKAISLKNDFIPAMYKAGWIYWLRNDWQKAINSLANILSFDKYHEETNILLGDIYVDKDAAQSLEYLQRAYKKNPKNPSVLYSLCRAFMVLQQPEKAISFIGNLDELNCNLTLLETISTIKDHICDWSDFEDRRAKLTSLITNNLNGVDEPPAQPFPNITTFADAEMNYRVACAYDDFITKRKPPYPEVKRTARLQKGGKITIGYLSPDFFDHATLHLMRGVFEYHDKSKFNIYCYSYSREDNSYYRREIEKYADKFVKINELSNWQAAELIASDEVDILVDLKGHIVGTRIEILKHRPAPIQVHYLGYPGTCGIKEVDYLITDNIVTPAGVSKYYREKLVFMPDTYQSTDCKQEIAGEVFSKDNLNIAAESFTFASFNQSYKITPAFFSIWMELLQEIPNSVLLLLKDTDGAVKNLKNEAISKGISADRIIFVERISKPKHLARLKIVDLCLDTEIYNGHTTTSDALWAGVPVITLKGTHFPSRVSASLLNAIGLPELVTSTKKEYKELAISLARDEQRRKQLKDRLHMNKQDKPLFNTKLFTKNLEAAYTKMHELGTSYESFQVK